MVERFFGLGLPEYPWDSLLEYKVLAQSYGGKLVDLSVGTPVDDTPLVVQQALVAAANAAGYPTAAGSLLLREAIVAWFARCRGVVGLGVGNVFPTVGSKEFIALLPFFLGLDDSAGVVFPVLSYPSYAMGARFVGAWGVCAEELCAEILCKKPSLVWVNSPANPTGRVLSVSQLRDVVVAARSVGALVVSDECYAQLGWGVWEQQCVPSLLDSRVTQGSLEGLLCVYSLSKQSNLAGYRAGLVAGDLRLMQNLLNSRRHAGLLVPFPVQEAMVAALGDDEHVLLQKQLYRRRRDLLLPALERFGFRVDGSEAGLYLWCTAGEDCWDSVRRFASLGVLVAPGIFYGVAGQQHVRVSLTAKTVDVCEVVDRLG